MLLRCRRRTSRRTSARGRRTARGSRWRTRACSARTAPTRRSARASATRGASLIYGHPARRPSGAARTSPTREGAWIGRRPSRRRRGRRLSRRSRPTRRTDLLPLPLARPFRVKKYISLVSYAASCSARRLVPQVALRPSSRRQRSGRIIIYRAHIDPTKKSNTRSPSAEPQADHRIFWQHPCVAAID